MAIHVEHTMRIMLPADKVWAVLEDFGSIERFQDKVSKSPVLPGVPSGLGARRRCEFYDNTSMVEEIIEFHQGQGYRFELSEYSLPLKCMIAEMNVVKIDQENCNISMSMDFIVKGGPVGWLAGQILMRPMMKNMIKKTLIGLAYHSATGNTVSNELPSKRELQLALAV